MTPRGIRYFSPPLAVLRERLLTELASLYARVAAIDAVMSAGQHPCSGGPHCVGRV